MTARVFCRIVEGGEPVEVVWEDTQVLAFPDNHPVADGHTLVIPKRHTTELADLPEASARRMIVPARRIAAALRSSPLRTEGINLFLADGEAGAQEVFHTQVHVVPRYASDGFSINGHWRAALRRN